MLIVGEKVFLPSYGAGVIIFIEDKKIDNEMRKYIKISLILNNMNLLIPETKIESYKIRYIEEEVLSICTKIIKEEPSNIEGKWTKRYRINNEKLDRGNILEECEVLRDLYYLKNKGIMPPGEQKILEKAENMVASEMALALNINLQEAIKLLRNEALERK